ncbi:MAG: chemotaxis protein CheC [bacterium]
MLTKYSQDKLNEIINIGAGNASTAMAKLLKKRVEITVPLSFIGKVEDSIEFFGGIDDVLTVIMVKVYGEVPGVIFLTFTPDAALKISQALAGDRSKTDIKDAYNVSTLNEVGNIISGSALTALSKFLKINMQQSVPAMAVDMVGAVTDTILAEVGSLSDTILVFKVEFSIPDTDTKGNLYFIFDPQATEKIIAATETIYQDGKNN